MQTDKQLTDDDLPPTMFELEQRRHAVETERNAKRERIRIRRANQKAGHDEPKPGSKIHVQLDGQVSKRNRAGIRFERGQQVTVEVIDATDEEVKLEQQRGKLVVNVYGAERILEDSALHVYTQPLADADVESLRARNAALEEELRLARADRDELAASVRNARMSAKDTGDGKPARLQAAAAARAANTGTAAQTGAAANTAAANTAAAEHSEFGAPAPDKK